jgi:diacylglycerol kinase family enzyme
VKVAETVCPTARRVLIGFNPRAGAQNRQAIVDELSRRLMTMGYQPVVYHEVERLTGAAREALAAGDLRGVVAAGGDGTFRLIADRTPPGTPLLVLPLGTENLLARYLGLTADPLQLAQIIDDGCLARFDAGCANHSLFTLMAGCGFDADVVRRLHKERRGHIHHFSYAKPILDAIRTYDYPELRVKYAPAASLHAAGTTPAVPHAAELTEEITARWVFVVNLPRYAGGLSFAPAASGSDGLLDICTFKEGSLWYGLMYLGGVVLGQHEGMQDFTRIQTTRLRVESTGKAPYQLDGDPGGELPVDFEVLPGRLTVLVDRTRDEQDEASRQKGT